MAATAFSVDPRDLLRASLLVSGAGASCHPDLAAFGEAACHVPQLHVQTLRGASQEVESVLRVHFSRSIKIPLAWPMTSRDSRACCRSRSKL